MKRLWFIFLLIATLGLLPVAALADNVALGKTVTGSGYFDSSQIEIFPYDNVTDGRYNDSGEGGDWSFWLTPGTEQGDRTRVCRYRLGSPVHR